MAALDNFFNCFSCDIKFDKFSDVLNDHFFDIQTKLIPLEEFLFLSFSKIFNTLIFFETFDSIVSISNGSAAAIIASTSLSPGLSLEGKLSILSLLVFFLFYSFIFFYIKFIKKLFCFIKDFSLLIHEPAKIPALPLFLF